MLHKYIWNHVSDHFYQLLNCRMLLKDEAIRPRENHIRKQYETAVARDHAGISCGHSVQYETNITKQ